MNQYYVYIMASQSKVLYTGVTNNLERRVYEHKKSLLPGFSSKYRTRKLVYFEAGSDIRSAIEREKQIKGWLRAKKVALIKSINPKWEDLGGDWYENVKPAFIKTMEIKKSKGAPAGDVRSKLSR